MEEREASGGGNETQPGDRACAAAVEKHGTAAALATSNWVNFAAICR
jgi:hypothetical protein